MSGGGSLGLLTRARAALSCHMGLDVGLPLEVGRDWVARECHHLGVPFGELRHDGGQVCQFCGTDWGKVGRVRAEAHPFITRPFCKGQRGGEVSVFNPQCVVGNSHGMARA